jgi:pilus assembly protein CpaC
VVRPVVPYQPIQANREVPGPVEIQLFVGETKVLPAPNIGRIAVGNGEVVNAAAIDSNEILVIANKAGQSSLIIWNKDGRYQRIKIHVVPGEIGRLQQEVSTFLSMIPKAKASVVGDKVMVEGEGLSDIDLAKIEEISRRYPFVINFTNRLGWEKMVLLDVVVAEFPVSKLREIGVRWSTLANGPTLGLGVDSASSRLTGRPGADPLGLPFPTSTPRGYFGLSSVLTSEINLLAQNGDAVILAQPMLSARNGSRAEFLAGGEIPYQIVGPDGTPGIQFKQYGVNLKFQPRVDANGNVRSTIETEVSDIDSSLSTPSGPALRTRKTNTEFNMRMGETLVLSGFMQKDMTSSVDKVPGLGDIPILGALFRSKRFQNKETELVVFVTPTVQDSGTSFNRNVIDKVQQRTNKIESQNSKGSIFSGYAKPDVVSAEKTEGLPKIVVLRSNVPLRDLPEENAQTIQVLDKGNRLYALNLPAPTGWVAVQIDNQTGWVKALDVEMPTEKGRK